MFLFLATVFIVVTTVLSYMNIDFIVIKTVARTMKTVVKIMFVQVHKKAALPIIRMDAAFLLLSSETVSRFPLCKDFVNLRSKIL